MGQILELTKAQSRRISQLFEGIRLGPAPSTTTQTATFWNLRNLLSWIESFLTNRFQRVVLDGQPSEWAKVTSGVPQGSIAGPLFFVMYVNDIGLQVKSTIKLFADDCAIYWEMMSSKD